MTCDADRSVTWFVRQLREGDPDAAENLWIRFSPRLLGLARKTFGNADCRMTDAEDAAQSAFVSFWKRASSGRFAEDLDRNELWSLLATITVRKVRRQLRRERTQKRGAGQVVPESSVGGSGALPFLLDEQSGHISAEHMDHTIEELLGILDEEPRAIVLLKLMDYTNREIAEIRGCTERKIERKLQLIRRIWNELNLGD